MKTKRVTKKELLLRVQAHFDDRKHIIKTKTKASERAGRLGGSDIAALLGQNPYKGPLDVYLSVMGLQNTPDNNFMRVGRYLENHIIRDLWVLANEYEIDIPRAVGDTAGYYHEDQPRLIAHPDGFAIYDDQLVGLEIKTSFTQNGIKKWSYDGMPAEYYIQCQTYLMITELPLWIVAGMAGSDFIFRKITPDAELHKLIRDEAGKFLHNHIDKNEMPMAVGTKSEQDSLKELLRANVYQIESPELCALIQIIEENQKLKSQAEAKATKARNTIMQALIDSDFPGYMKVHITNQNKVASPRTIEVTTVSQNRVNSDRLKQEFPLIYTRCLKSSSYNKLKIKPEGK